VASALTPPYLVAALVVLAAGLAKLRAPGGAADAVATLGLGWGGGPGRERLVRAGALAEVVAAASALAGLRVAPYLLGAAFLGFAAAASALVRARAQCGCFGESDAPVSAIHVTLNLALAAACLAAGAAGSAGPAAIGRLPGWEIAPAALGILAAGGAAVLAYVELPRAWQAWTGAAG
jgi:hypothetical protein